jgi:uncharacterized protein YbjT (DUF2867 family)
MFFPSLINSTTAQENALIFLHLLRYSWNHLLHLNVESIFNDNIITMNIFLVGATGRVGTEFLKLALTSGNRITAFIRDPKKLSMSHPALTLLTGDLNNAASLKAAFSSGKWDAIVNVAGADPFKPSTLVTDAAKALIPLAEEAKIPRYLAITGTPRCQKTWAKRSLQLF